MMEQSRLYLTICVLALCAVSRAYSSIPSKFAFTGVTFIGKLAFSELLFNFAPAEAGSYPFSNRFGHYAKSSEESDEDEDENASHGGRIELPKPKTNPQNGDQCLAKLLCGMSVAASTRATKPNYYKDYAHLVSRYFQVFGSEDGSIESIEAYDDYSLEDEEPPPAPPKSKAPEKFDISLGFTSFLGSINNSTADDNDPIVSPKSVRNRGAGKLSQRLARAEKIVANLNRQGRKPQPSQCQSLTGCSYSFKELRAKLKSGTKEKLTSISSSSGKAPLRYKVHGSGAKPTSSGESNEQQFLAFKDPNKGDDELDEIFGSSDAFAPAKPKKKKNQQSPEPPPPPPIYIRRTIIKKKHPSGANDDEESASTTIIRVAPVPIQPQQNKPIQILQQADIGDEEKPKRKVSYKKPPKKTKVKDNGDDEDDDINQTLPVKIITSDEYNDDHHKIYNVDNGYFKDVVPAPPAKAVTTKAPLAFPKKRDEDSDEDDDEEDEESEEDEENDDEEDEESSKKRKAPIEESKPEIIVEDDSGSKKKLADDDEAAEAQKDFWGGLTFVKRQKEKDTNAKSKTKTKYKVSKIKGQSSASNEEESKEDENSSKESEENDDKEIERTDAGKKQPGNKILRGKLDIDIPPSAEHDLVFPSRKEKEKVSLKPKKEKDNKKDNKKKDDSSSEEENASIVITEIGGRPLAPPQEASLKGRKPSANVGQPSPFKLQFISPYTSKQQSSSYSSPSVYGGNINKPEKLRPAAAAAPLTSHAFLKSNLPTNADNTNVQGKPDMFSRISSLSPISSITNFFRKGSNSQQDNIQDNNAPPSSPFMKRPVGPESSKFRRAPSRDKKKKKF